MVFCYKIITDTPRRSGNVSPRKTSPVRKLPNVPSSLSQLISSVDYENESVLNFIPEREWRLLAALARKREEDQEREKLADQFRKMWQKEKEERQIVEAEAMNQYKQYINHKRQKERRWQDYKRMQMTARHQMRVGQLLDCIIRKDQRSKDLLAMREDQKIVGIIDKALEEEARAVLAADRRGRQVEAEQWKRHLELANSQMRARSARDKRTARLRDSAQRVAINNALSSWETSLLRQEVLALDATRRAHHAAHAALTEERSANIARQKEKKLNRARKMAAVTAQMREDLKSGRVLPSSF